jgi:phosphomannomutase
MSNPAPTSRDLAALLAARAGPEYRCPGETYAINRAVHLARLASGYEACRLCVHRQDDPRRILGSTVDPVPETSLIEAPRDASRLVEATRPGPQVIGAGLRGRYLNDLTRADVTVWAARIANRLRAESPDTPPLVVIAYDTRPSSPDLYAGLAPGLRRAGCHVLDLGLVPQPVAWFALSRHRAQAVVYLTGAGCDTAWNGLDVTTSGPLPWTSGRGWPDLLPATPGMGSSPEQTSFPGLTAPTGDLTPLRQESARYLAALADLFHGLRPLRFVLGIPSAPQRRLAEALLAPRAVSVDWLDCGPRPIDLENADDVDLARLRDLIFSRTADFGLFIHEDGFRISLFTADGTPVDPVQLARFLGGQPLDAPAGHRAVLFTQPYPDPQFALLTTACDGLLTLARLLLALSESDAPLAQRLM